MATDVIPKDPLESPTWEAMAENHLSGFPIVFDKDVVIGLPPVTEDQTQVPIMVDAKKLGTIDELVVIGDLNPFPVTVRLRPGAAPAVVAFRMRIEQGMVIRAAARKDGVWHVGERYLDAAGGGCSAPPVAEAKVNWDDVGQMRAKLWREDQDRLRLRLRITHPMDSGLHKEPAFFIQSLEIKDAAGARLADMEIHEVIASNPVFTIVFADPKHGDHVALTAKDNDGGVFNSKVPMVQVASAGVIREGRL